MNPAYRLFTLSGMAPVPELSTAPLAVMMNQRAVGAGRSWKPKEAAVGCGTSPLPDFTTLPSFVTICRSGGGVGLGEGEEGSRGGG